MRVRASVSERHRPKPRTPTTSPGRDRGGVDPALLVMRGAATRGFECARATPQARSIARLLRDPAPEVREAALRGLVESRPLARTTEPALVVALDDDTPRIRAVAARALWRLGLRLDRVAEFVAGDDVLGDSLFDAKDREITSGISLDEIRRLRPWFVACLVDLVGAMRAPLPALRGDTSPVIRELNACRVHWLAERAGDRILPTLERALEVGDMIERIAALELLADLGPRAAPALAELERSAARDVEPCRGHAAAAIARIRG